VTNAEVQQTIVDRLMPTLLPRPRRGTVPVVGALQPNYYSFTFSVDVEADNGPVGVFVKIPKRDLRLSGPNILPVTDADRQLASEETRSLRHLVAAWRGEDLRARWIRLVGELPEFNAIVTTRVVASEALDVIRASELRRRIGALAGVNEMRDMMRRLGTAFGRFHEYDATPGPFVVASFSAKLQRYVMEIGRTRPSAFLSSIAGWMGSFGAAPERGLVATTIKGIDIRNMLLSERGDITLLDPGRMKRTFREADVARFLLTYRILHWGQPWFALGWRPDPGSERAFLQGYASAGAAAGDRLLRLYVVKEILKHWHTAHASLEAKAWRAPVSRLVRSAYIDRFYERLLAEELRNPL
jgi:hypothetical protein